MDQIINSDRPETHRLKAVDGLYFVPVIDYDLGGDGDVFIKDEVGVEQIGKIYIDGAGIFIYRKVEENAFIIVSCSLKEIKISLI